MVHLILVLAIIGFIAFVVTKIPMLDAIRWLILGLLCFFALIYALQVLGINTGFGHLHLN